MLSEKGEVEVPRRLIHEHAASFARMGGEGM